jgi:WD40-like Beta Propeller Repeat
MTLPVDYVNQVDYLADLVSQIQLLNEGNVITVQKTTEPVQVDFMHRWLEEGHTGPIEPGYDFHWFDGTNLRGIYGAIDDGVKMLHAKSYSIDSYSVAHYSGTTAARGLGRWSPVIGDERIITRDTVLDPVYLSPQSGIYTIDLMGNRTLLSRPTAHYSDYDPCFSPDASKAVYVTTEYGGVELAKMNIDGSSRTQLTTNAYTEAQPQWCGTKIFFNAQRAVTPTYWHILVMNDDGTGEIALTSGSYNNLFPHISLDGTKIVFLTNRDTGTGIYYIYTMDADGSNPLNTGISCDSTTGTTPQWSSDNQYIFFSQAVAYSGWDTISYPNIQLVHRMDADGSNIIRVGTYLPAHQQNIYTINQTPFMRDAGACEQSVEMLSISPDDSRILTNGFSHAISGLSNCLLVWPIDVTAQVDPDSIRSTGAIRLLQSYNQSWADFKLLGKLEGNVNDLNITNIPPEYGTLLIVGSGQWDAAAGTSEQMAIILNNDEGANYNTFQTRFGHGSQINTEVLAGTNIPYQMAIDVTSVLATGNMFLLIPDIQSTDSYKALIGLGGYAQHQSTLADLRFTVFAMGYYMSLNQITEIRIRSANNLPLMPNSIISVYGLNGKGRFKPV